MLDFVEDYISYPVYTSGRNLALIYRVGIIPLDYSALWFSIYLALPSYFWPSSFLFIQPFGFGLLDKSDLFLSRFEEMLFSNSPDSEK